MLERIERREGGRERGSVPTLAIETGGGVRLQVKRGTMGIEERRIRKNVPRAAGGGAASPFSPTLFPPKALPPLLVMLVLGLVEPGMPFLALCIDEGGRGR